MNQLLKGCSEALEQVSVIIHAIGQHTEEVYQTTRAGSHVRHMVDHFIALQQGIASGIIDYNRRNRDSVIESDINEGLQAIENIINALGKMTTQDRKVSVISEIDCHQTLSEHFDSTVRRELLYLINHTIHHTAYMKLLVKPFGVELPDEIGIAPGTATFLRNTQTA